VFVPGCGHLHFRCTKHAVDGHYEIREGAYQVACEVPGCSVPPRAYWYREAKFETLPITQEMRFCLD
jgi:hypothetical protein